MQLGGKRSTNAAKYAYLTNNLLYFGSKKNASSMESFNIEGALLKKAQTETKLKAAIEVLHPSRPFCYPPRVDYFYLIFKSEKGASPPTALSHPSHKTWSAGSLRCWRAGARSTPRGRWRKSRRRPPL